MECYLCWTRLERRESEMKSLRVQNARARGAKQAFLNKLTISHFSSNPSTTSSQMFHRNRTQNAVEHILSDFYARAHHRMTFKDTKHSGPKCMPMMGPQHKLREGKATHSNRAGLKRFCLIMKLGLLTQSTLDSVCLTFLIN